jgi:hypothetical protein
MAACAVAETDLIPARMLNEAVYCPREPVLVLRRTPLR